MAATSSLGEESTNTLIATLSSVSKNLGGLQSKSARKEALRLSKAITAHLEEPENVAVDLAFSVRQVSLSKYQP